jgi:hypothetical protein
MNLFLYPFAIVHSIKEMVKFYRKLLQEGIGL